MQYNQLIQAKSSCTENLFNRFTAVCWGWSLNALMPVLVPLLFILTTTSLSRLKEPFLLTNISRQMTPRSPYLSLLMLFSHLNVTRIISKWMSFNSLCIKFWNLIKKNFPKLILIHSFILAISIVPLQVLYHSEALPTTARILYRSFTPKRTGNCR